MQDTSTTTSPSPAATKIRYRAPIWTLLILAPVISEVLSGSTRLSILFVLVPEVMIWGGGALLCRELARRWRAGATSLLLLGLALSVAEEFIIQQTSLAPLPFPGANASYGRFLGVNWVYFLFMLGYESAWVVLVPVQLTELLFPLHRDKPWLQKRGLIATCIAFLLGCRVAWYGWTQRARPSLHAAPYHPPLIAIAVGLLAIVLLIWFAYLARALGHPGHDSSRRARNPWLVGITALILGTGWWALMTLVFSPRPAISAPAAMLNGLVWAGAGLGLLLYWSTGAGWTDMHRWAAAFAATVSCMLPGYLSLVGWTRSDLIFKILIDLAAVVAMLVLAREIARQAQHQLAQF